MDERSVRMRRVEGKDEEVEKWLVLEGYSGFL